MGQTRPKHMMDYWLTPWRTSLAFSAAWLETSLALQKSYLSMMQNGTESPDQMRDAFRTAADANIRRWGMAADALKTMPDWYQTSLNLPGGVLTDAFDQAQRLRRSR